MAIALVLTKVYIANLVILIGAGVVKFGWQIVYWGSGIAGIKADTPKVEEDTTPEYTKKYWDRVQ